MNHEMVFVCIGEGKRNRGGLLNRVCLLHFHCVLASDMCNSLTEKNL